VHTLNEFGCDVHVTEPGGETPEGEKSKKGQKGKKSFSTFLALLDLLAL